MTSIRLVPVESTTIQETMESLGLNFSLDPVVTKALLATKIQNLEEFRFLLRMSRKSTRSWPSCNSVMIG